MRTVPVSMSEPALAQLAGTLGLSGKWFLPESDGGPGEFIKAREEWEKEGLAQLDFDGSLHPVPRFARMLYNLTHARSAMLYESGEEKVLFLKGTADVLMLVQRKRKGSWELALRPFHEALWQIRQLAEGCVPGRFLVLGEGEEEPFCREPDPDSGQEERLYMIESCLAYFYRREGNCPLLSDEKREEEDNA